MHIPTITQHSISDPPQVWPARQQKLTVPLQQISSDLQQPLPQTGSLD
ncbi:2975_t:CDS:2 [Entrophospora sp. SA101]|nr:2975_t:CDS:2 [Entrophospora sp. SA101]